MTLSHQSFPEKPSFLCFEVTSPTKMKYMFDHGIRKAVSSENDTNWCVRPPISFHLSREFKIGLKSNFKQVDTKIM